MTMKVWISKYALTEGLLQLEVEQSDQFPEMVSDARMHLRAFHGEGREWHRTRADAVVRAKQMQRDKLRSLQKQIERVKAIDFGSVE